jgi:hypothetical protein
MIRKVTGFYLNQDLVQRLRNAVAALENTPNDVGNMSAVIERLMQNELTRLEQLNNGEPFPTVGQLPRGSRKLPKEK